MRYLTFLLASFSIALCQNITKSSIPLSEIKTKPLDPYLVIPYIPVKEVFQLGLGPQIIPPLSPQFAFADDHVLQSASTDSTKTLLKLFASGMTKALSPTKQGARWNLYFNAIESKQGKDGFYHSLYAVIPVFEVLPNPSKGVSDTVYATLGEALRIRIVTRNPVELGQTKPQEILMEPTLNPGLSPKTFAKQIQALMARNSQFFILR